MVYWNISDEIDSGYDYCGETAQEAIRNAENHIEEIGQNYNGFLRCFNSDDEMIYHRPIEIVHGRIGDGYADWKRGQYED